MNQTLNELRAELALRNQRGITFIMAATVYWSAVGLAGLKLPPSSAFIASIWGTGILFPLSILFAKALRIDIFYKNALTPLGVWANVFQLFFFPILFIAARANIFYPPVFMGVLAGAHFVFYHWLYRSPVYLVMAFVVSSSSYALGFMFPDQTYVVVGFSNALWLGLGVAALSIENHRHSRVITA
jgi:hypothetical protein